MEEIEEWVRTQIKSGEDPELIKKVLKNRGYNTSLVASVLKESVKKNLPEEKEIKPLEIKQIGLGYESSRKIPRISKSSISLPKINFSFPRIRVPKLDMNIPHIPLKAYLIIFGIIIIGFVSVFIMNYYVNLRIASLFI